MTRKDHKLGFSTASSSPFRFPLTHTNVLKLIFWLIRVNPIVTQVPIQ